MPLKETPTLVECKGNDGPEWRSRGLGLRLFDLQGLQKINCVGEIHSTCHENIIVVNSIDVIVLLIFGDGYHTNIIIVVGFADISPVGTPHDSGLVVRIPKHDYAVKCLEGVIISNFVLSVIIERYRIIANSQGFRRNRNA